MEPKKARYSKAGPYIIRKTLGSGGFGVYVFSEFSKSFNCFALE